MTEWIRYEDQHPLHKQQVITWDELDNQHTFSVFYDVNEDYEDDPDIPELIKTEMDESNAAEHFYTASLFPLFEDYNVTHWLPLPEPPKEG